MNPQDESKSAPAVAVGSVRVAVSQETDEVLRELDQKLLARILACRDSERLSEEDLAVRINVRD